MKTSTRRGFLGATVALSIAAHVTAPQASPIVAHPDAELIALAERFIAGELAVQDWPPGPDGDLPEPEFNLAIARQNDLISAMAALHATTGDGVAAWARCLAAHNSHLEFSMDDPDTFTGRLVHYLMRDAAALGGCGLPSPIGGPVQSLDAELLDLCAEFDRLERAYIGHGGNYKPGSPEDEAAEAERDRLTAAQDPLVERICELRAVTHGGHVARARSLALWDAELLKDGPGDTGTCLTAAIVRDLVAGSAEA